MKITLDDAEQRLAQYVARKRFENARNNGVEDRRIDDQQSNEFLDLEGMAGEIAFCKLFNVYPDLSIVPPGKLPPEDCVLRDGRTVDVKTTRYPSGCLVVVPWKLGKVDYYAMMIGEFPTYEFAGAVTADRVRDIRVGERETKGLDHEAMKRSVEEFIEAYDRRDNELAAT